MDPVSLAWRTGQPRRTIYAQLSAKPSGSDPFTGIMDTPELASEAVAAHNALLGLYPQANGSRP